MKKFNVALKACLNYMCGRILEEPNNTKVVDEVVDEYANELFSLAQVLKDDNTHPECDASEEPAKVNTDKFIALLVEIYCKRNGIDRTLVGTILDDVLEKMGFKVENGNIVELKDK